MAETYGTFTKGDRTRVANTIDQAVALRFNGWRETEVAPEPQPTGAPPKAGAGSGRDEWADYARANDLTVDDDMKREDIIDALHSAGIPTEQTQPAQ